MRATPLVAAVCLCLAGCIFQNLTPTRQLQDTVYQFNDETRWARIDLASQRVVPAYRVQFLLAHRAWGHDIAIADVDPTNIQIDEDGEHARSLVTVTWYDQRTLDLTRTVLTQQWDRTDSGFMLSAETIVGGSELLLEEVGEDETQPPAPEPIAAR